ncbi:hypothetical protein F4861DRAFT_499798 [Xylaria intraflava]|nr:hypothetical protein F4861DRAFT_499798 [Xylaria intraflava]
MDRNRPEAEGFLTTKANGRKNNTQPFGDRHPSNKALGDDFKENNIASGTDGGARTIPRLTTHTTIQNLENRRASPGPGIGVDHSTAVFGTPRDPRSTRIPRPKTTAPVIDNHHQGSPKRQSLLLDQAPDISSPMRQPMDFKAAFKRAQEQDAAETKSDSDNTVDLQQAFNLASVEFNANRGIDGSPSPAPRPMRRESKNDTPSSNRRGAKANDLSKHLERFDRNHQLGSGLAPSGGLFSKNHAVPRALEARRSLRTKSNGNGLGDSPGSQMIDTQSASPRERGSVERSRALAKRLSAVNSHLGNLTVNGPVLPIESEHANDDRSSPDFNPADLSPEKSMNWHLDADFTASDLQFSESPRITINKPDFDPSHRTGMSAIRRGNDRLSMIRQREAEAARIALPADTPATAQTNHRLDEVRFREMEAESRRAVASSRLDEIRIRNSEPRNELSQQHMDSSKKPLGGGSSGINAKPPNAPPSSSDPEPRAESIRDGSVMVKNQNDMTFGISERDRSQDNEDKRDRLSRSDSHDLLRRLARVTGSSPREKSKRTEQVKDIPSTEMADAKLPETRGIDYSPLSQEKRGVWNLGVKHSKDRPAVGFATLMKTSSSESLEAKRASKPTSEADPVDRIEAELNLFAPLDSYSEKGSIRAPSPVSEFTDEETPRPPKIDPLTQPTPRISGAYVDTPATVRTKEEQGLVALEQAKTARGRNHSLSPTKRATNLGVTSQTRVSKRAGPRSSSAPTASRRSKSSSRLRRPLVNTAKPPSVREDILTILRANNIDDSTLENLDSILADREVVKDTLLKVGSSEGSDRERELEAYDRMRKSLQTGLLGIRSAKEGIERLEDKVTHNRGKREESQPRDLSTIKPQSPSTSDESAPLLISLPRLYRRNPKFKLTGLGIFIVWAFIWYALESTFSFLYAGPEYICTPSIPCDWSPNDPYFPYTMPFMLDEWATGGKGRALALTIGEEVGDMFAEAMDWVTNTDFSKSDELYMDAWQRKRHRRRLRKHGLIPEWKEPPGYQSIFPAWQAEKAARELAQELGLDTEDETMSVDEIVW